MPCQAPNFHQLFTFAAQLLACAVVGFVGAVAPQHTLQGRKAGSSGAAKQCREGACVTAQTNSWTHSGLLSLCTLPPTFEPALPSPHRWLHSRSNPGCQCRTSRPQTRQIKALLITQIETHPLTSSLATQS